MEPKIKTILLDLDGTIVDSREAYQEAAKTAFTTFGQKANPKAVLEIPKRLEQRLPIDNLLNGIDSREFLKVYLNAYNNATTEKAKLIPHATETLKRLSKKATLAIITMRHVSKEKITEELEKLGLSNYFQYVVTALDTPNSKPSPEALIKCADHFRILPRNCLVVGDSVIDIRAGKAFGAKTVAVLSGIYTQEELKREKPDLIMKNVNNLPNLLELLEK
jgi:phosphoglycolate phosphatase